MDKYKFKMWFWKIFDKIFYPLAVFFFMLLISVFIYIGTLALNDTISYIDNQGLKYVIERIWYGKNIERK